MTIDSADTSSPTITRIARITALLLTLVLFTLGNLPAAGQAFPGILHWVAHFSAYALIAFTFSLGWPHRPAVYLGLLVAAIGVLHETTEIITHHHTFETEDVMVNALAALLGIAVHRLFRHPVQ
ncbi:hypothetical protein [Ferrovum myxofaciens]|uniref:hypothetical protein n=1 Tax=Ferrovum myxofaciens TaxID=416213 RepID=UPI003EBC7F1F